MMSIALRFIPILVEETDKIKKAQMARGADFETGNIVRVLKAMVPLLVPLYLCISQSNGFGNGSGKLGVIIWRRGKNKDEKPLRYTKL